MDEEFLDNEGWQAVAELVPLSFLPLTTHSIVYVSPDSKLVEAPHMLAAMHVRIGCSLQGPNKPLSFQSPPTSQLKMVTAGNSDKGTHSLWTMLSSANTTVPFICQYCYIIRIALCQAARKGPKTDALVSPPQATQKTLVIFLVHVEVWIFAFTSYIIQCHS